MRRFRILTAALCAAVLLSGLSATAYAGGGEEVTGGANWEGLKPVEETPAPTLEHGEGFSEDGAFTTRDLLYDKHTNKQFITVQTVGGSTFYIVIDYDRPVNEDEEQYMTYFLSTVDEADLLAAMEAAGLEVPACSYTDKCKAGAIDTACPVCAVNMTECAGAEPVPDPVPDIESEPEQPEKTAGGGGTLLLALAVVFIGGGAGWYFKIYRPKQQAAQTEDEGEYEGYDDTPPWDEEDYTEETEDAE